MSVDGTELRRAMELVNRLSDEMIGCYDVDDLEGEEEELKGYFEKMVQEGSISIMFPGETDWIRWPADDFVRQAEECKSLRVGTLVTLRTDNLAIQLVSSESHMAGAVQYKQMPLLVETESKLRVRLRYESLAIGIEASRVGAWEDDIYGALTAHTSVGADFTNFAGDRTEQFESDIVDSYLFELASSHGVVFQRSTFPTDITGYPPEDWDELPEFKLRPLEGVNDGIRLFLAAAQVSDRALRFFSFYKVLEHFGPTVLNLEAHECLRKKLDSKEALAPTGQFIRDILVISKSFDQRRNDRDLIRGVLLTGVDLVGINSLVPAVFRRPISYESSAKDIEQYARDLAERLCATRHQVAHAKAQYEPRGTECKPDELAKFTDFLEAAASEVIRWYNRLPEHQKSDLG